jgi:sulfatase modifying factor 1
MTKGSWGAWTVALSTTAGGCALVVGIDKDYHPLGEGGASGAGTSASSGSGAGGASGTGTSSSSGSGGASGTGMVGALGGLCPQAGVLACAGNAQKSKLICGPEGKWATNGTCDGDELCDTTVGGDQGTCKPVVAACAGKSPADVVCDKTKRVKCGPDRVTTEEVETCPSGCSLGACVGPSCAGLPATCGPDGNESCCASPIVLGGKYNRSNDPMFPATVSDFRLDRFEITVGRFRAFVAAYPGNKPAAGAGMHPRIAGSEWDAAWDGSLPADLKGAVKCSSSYQTWIDTPGANENLPMNCISWYEAFAFCAWDGGRLPTEAEWNYAAAGGSKQKDYPWGSISPDGTHAVYACTGDGSNSSSCALTDILKVGSKPAGDGEWEQADLAGSMWEWNLDWWETYPNPSPAICTDCANLKSALYRVIRGGSWGDFASGLLSSSRNGDDPSVRNHYIGARCARNP